MTPRTPASPCCHGDTDLFTEGSSWLNTLGIPRPSLLSPPLLNPPKSHEGASSSPLARAVDISLAVCRLEPHPSALLSSSSSLSKTSSHYTEEPSAEALSHFFISVVASQQVSSSPSWHPLTLATVGGERMANP